jgi:hypothetical protein
LWAFAFVFALFGLGISCGGEHSSLKKLGANM